MGLLFIALSVSCSLTIAHFLKLSKKSNARLINVLTINYLMAFAISFSISGRELSQGMLSNPNLLIFAVVLGAIFIANLFVYSASLNKIGMGISIAAMRMSLVIPIGLSLFFYSEEITALKYAGIVLVFLALYLMIPKMDSSGKRELKNSLFPILLFLMTGDLINKNPS